MIVATPTGSTAYFAGGGRADPGFPDEGRCCNAYLPAQSGQPGHGVCAGAQAEYLWGQVADDEVFISCDGRAGCPLKAGATAEVRLSDQVVKLITFGKADQFQAIDQKLRSRR